MVWHKHFFEGDIDAASPFECHHVPVVAKRDVIGRDGCETHRATFAGFDTSEKKPFRMSCATHISVTTAQADTAIDESEDPRRHSHRPEEGNRTGSEDLVNSRFAHFRPTHTCCAGVVKACPSCSGIGVTKSFEVTQLRGHRQFVASNVRWHFDQRHSKFSHEVDQSRWRSIEPLSFFGCLIEVSVTSVDPL